MNPISLGRQSADSMQQEVLRGLHETFAQELSSSLSAFLQAEIGISLGAISYPSASDFLSALQAPCGLISFQLEPQPEQGTLYLDCSTVFGLLELLLGGSIGSGPAGSGQQRNLTEIEWDLLEEVVRV